MLSALHTPARISRTPQRRLLIEQWNPSLVDWHKPASVLPLPVWTVSKILCKHRAERGGTRVCPYLGSCHRNAPRPASPHVPHRPTYLRIFFVFLRFPWNFSVCLMCGDKEIEMCVTGLWACAKLFWVPDSKKQNEGMRQGPKSEKFNGKHSVKDRTMQLLDFFTFTGSRKLLRAFSTAAGPVFLCIRGKCDSTKAQSYEKSNFSMPQSKSRLISHISLLWNASKTPAKSSTGQYGPKSRKFRSLGACESQKTPLKVE